MAIDKDEMLNRLQEMAQDAKAPECPEFFKDERLEDAFKEPVTNENGEYEPLPTIFNDYGYGENSYGVCILLLRSASQVSNLYSKYLDALSLVWESNNERLLLYIPDENQPKVAFKGSAWQFAKRLKPEYENHITLKNIYYEFNSKK